jgi:hypothetical protein
MFDEDKHDTLEIAVSIQPGPGGTDRPGMMA